MFFYLSFLRPPPSQVSPSGSISITPQVANDLRTELFAESQEIYYSWSYVTQSTENASTLPLITKPQKLTLWRSSGAYKEIPVPLPPGAREGQLCRLVLTTHGQGNPHVINLASAILGQRPFPVMSVPILLSARRAGAGGKQEQIERIYRIATSPQDQVFITVREQTSFDLDKKVWDSGIGLSSWLIEVASNENKNEELPVLNSVKDTLFASEGRRILELGTGTGIVSLTLGALRSKHPPAEGGCIITTDLASAMPLLEHNITANSALFESSSTRPEAIVLDWDDEHLPEKISSVQGGFDVIVMADVTYNTSSFPSLIRTLSALLHLGSSRPPLLLLGYKERDAAERSLWDMASGIGLYLQKVGGRPGAGGESVEIWVGTMQ